MLIAQAEIRRRSIGNSSSTSFVVVRTNISVNLTQRSCSHIKKATYACVSWVTTGRRRDLEKLDNSERTERSILFIFSLSFVAAAAKQCLPQRMLLAATLTATTASEFFVPTHLPPSGLGYRLAGQVLSRDRTLTGCRYARPFPGASFWVVGVRADTASAKEMPSQI